MDDDDKKLQELDAKLKAIHKTEPVLRDKTPEDNQKAVMKAGASAGVEFAAAILFCTAFGVWLDKTFGTMPIFLFIFMFLGMVVAFYNLYRASENLSAKNTDSQLPSSEKDAKKTPVLEESNVKD